MTTIIVAIITSISAIGASILTQFLRNRHEQEMKKLELQSTAKFNAINNFIDSTLNCSYIHSDKTEFYKSLNKVIPFIDDTSSKYVAKIKELIENGCNIELINNELVNLTIYLGGKDNIKSIKRILHPD